MAMSGKSGDFWDLGDFRKSNAKISHNSVSRDTSAVEISANNSVGDTQRNSADSSVSYQHFSDSSITKFIPPHTDSAFKKKYCIFEYEPQNPFIKKVRLLGEREDTILFSKENLFMRERAALLNRSASEVPFVPFYSYSPRYSQLTKPQLRYYLWWRQNVREGVYLKTEISYLMLYVYELATSDEHEDLSAALNYMCALLVNYTSREINITVKMMIRDIICDFCLIHNLTPPMHMLSGIEPQIINRSFLPEIFAFSSDSIDLSMSVYDYRKSKFYSDNAEIFDTAMQSALNTVLTSKEAFESLTSFTKGLYGAVTSERHPFSRLVNITSRSVSVEVTYFELSNVRPAITDIVRYCENKLREHLGIKNKISIMSVNPTAKSVIDEFFELNYPPRPTIDRRRRDAKIEHEVHEYDKLYDIPKAEISPERALKIERESWDTTKILTEAFSDYDAQSDIEQDLTQKPESVIAEPRSPALAEPTDSICTSSSVPTSVNTTEGQESAYSKLCGVIGEGAKLIELCLNNAPATEQRRLAASLGISLDELADTINEASLDVVGDIVLESYDGVSYSIIEDYKDLFSDL